MYSAVRVVRYLYGLSRMGTRMRIVLKYFKAKQPSSGICTNLAVQRLTFRLFSPTRTIFLLFHRCKQPRWKSVRIQLSLRILRTVRNLSRFKACVFAHFVACPTCKVREWNRRRGVERQMGAASKIRRKEFLVTCWKTFGDEKRKNNSVHFYWLLATSYFYSTTFNQTFGQIRTLPTRKCCVPPKRQNDFSTMILIPGAYPFCFESRFRGGFVRLQMVTMRK